MFAADEKDAIVKNFTSKEMYRFNFARMRGPAFDAAISAVLDGYWNNYGAIMDGEYETDVLSMLPNNSPVRFAISEAKRLGKEKIYNDSKKVEMEIGCYATFDVLLRELCQAAIVEKAEVLRSEGQKKLSWKSDRVMRLLGDHAPSEQNGPPGGWNSAQCLRRAVEFVSGMTDNYAVYVAKQLRGDAFSGGQRP